MKKDTNEKKEGQPKPSKKISPEEALKIPLRCSLNGYLKLLTVGEIKNQLKVCDLYWICFRDIYGWNTHGYRGESCICKKTGRKAMNVGFKIHTSPDPYTLEQAQDDFNGGNIIDDYNVFNAWAAKFNSIFKGEEEEIQTKGKKKKRKKDLLPRDYWPFYYLEVPAGLRATWPAYKLNPDLNIIVIIGVAPNNPYSNSDIPRELLSTEFTLKRKSNDIEPSFSHAL